MRGATEHGYYIDLVSLICHPQQDFLIYYNFSKPVSYQPVCTTHSQCHLPHFST